MDTLQNMIDMIIKETAFKEHNPTRPSNKNRQQGAHEDPKQNWTGRKNNFKTKHIKPIH
jgi:hypothetical protein